MMTIEEAVSSVIEAGSKGKGGETYILDMGEPLNVLTLAKEVIAKSGKDVEIKEIGIRKGEVLQEALMFKEEEERAEKQNGYWVIK